MHSSSSEQAFTQSLMWEILKESMKWPSHMYAPWHSRAGQLVFEHVLNVKYINQENKRKWVDGAHFIMVQNTLIHLCILLNSLHLIYFRQMYIYSQPFTTDTIRAYGLVWWSRCGAVCEQDTEILNWFKWPPIAEPICTAKLVAEVDIFSMAKGKTIFLECGSF